MKARKSKGVAPREDHRVRVAREKRERMRDHLLGAVVAVYPGKPGQGPAVIDDVIRVAKVSRGTFYKYYPSLEEAVAELGAKLAAEMVAAIGALYDSLEDPIERSATAFLKAGRRKAMEISVVCVAARLTLDASGRCAEARIALGAVAPRTVRARTAERALEGQPLSPDLFRRAGDLALEDCDPISDVRASARFRRHLAGTLVRRALERCVARAGVRL